MPWLLAYQPCRGGEYRWCADKHSPPAVQQAARQAPTMGCLAIVSPACMQCACLSACVCLPACLQEDAHIAELELDPATKTALFSGTTGRRRQPARCCCFPCHAPHPCQPCTRLTTRCPALLLCCSV